MQLCLKPRGARGIVPETFRRRGQHLSCFPTTGPILRPLDWMLICCCLRVEEENRGKQFASRGLY